MESSSWILSFDFLADPKRRDHFEQSNFELLCSYTWPYLDYERLRICCDFINLIFVLDEITDYQTEEDVKETTRTFLRALNGEITEDSPLAAMIHQ